MKITEREKHLLWLLLNNTITQYLLSFRPNDTRAGMRADYHIKISKLLCNYITCNGGEHTLITNNCMYFEYTKNYDKVHDWIADNISDRLDETIGYDIVHKIYYGESYDEFTKRFFDIIIDNIETIEKLVLSEDD